MLNSIAYTFGFFRHIVIIYIFSLYPITTFVKFAIIELIERDNGRLSVCIGLYEDHRSRVILIVFVGVMRHSRWRIYRPPVDAVSVGVVQMEAILCAMIVECIYRDVCSVGIMLAIVETFGTSVLVAFNLIWQKILQSFGVEIGMVYVIAFGVHLVK